MRVRAMAKLPNAIDANQQRRDAGVGLPHGALLRRVRGHGRLSCVSQKGYGPRSRGLLNVLAWLTKWSAGPGAARSAGRKQRRSRTESGRGAWWSASGRTRNPEKGGYTDRTRREVGGLLQKMTTPAKRWVSASPASAAPSPTAMSAATSTTTQRPRWDVKTADVPKVAATGVGGVVTYQDFAMYRMRLEMYLGSFGVRIKNFEHGGCFEEAVAPPGTSVTDHQTYVLHDDQHRLRGTAADLLKAEERAGRDVLTYSTALPRFPHRLGLHYVQSSQPHDLGPRSRKP